MHKPLTIAGIQIKPGTRTDIQIPVAPLFNHSAMAMPVHVIHGKHAGPRLFVCGAVHGDEIIGTEIIHRLIRLKKLKNLRGTLITVPVVNMYAFVQHSRYSPDRRDLNRFFPGSETGSLTSQLAHIFMQEIVKTSDFGIDLHAGSNHRANLPQIRADIADQQVLALARMFQVPVVINSPAREGSLRQSAAKEGVCMLLYEAGEALRFDEVGVRAGVRGILRVMETIGMLASKSGQTHKNGTLITDATAWVRAPVSGILHMDSPLGGKVTQNTRIGSIVDPFGGHEMEIISPISGMVIGRLNLPLVHQGDAIIHIAHLEGLKRIEPIIQGFTEDFLTPA